MIHAKKVVLLGHFGVGKTSLIRKFVDSAFEEDYLVTVGVHVKKKQITIGEEIVSLIIWDIEGNTSIDKARNSYLLGTQGFIYAFDVTRPETYQNISDEISYLNTNFKDIPVKIAANKADLFTEDFNESFFSEAIFKDCYFTSAKNGQNVEKMFQELAVKLIA